MRSKSDDTLINLNKIRRSRQLQHDTSERMASLSKKFHTDLEALVMKLGSDLCTGPRSLGDLTGRDLDHFTVGTILLSGAAAHLSKLIGLAKDPSLTSQLNVTDVQALASMLLTNLISREHEEEKSAYSAFMQGFQSNALFKRVKRASDERRATLLRHAQISL